MLVIMRHVRLADEGAAGRALRVDAALAGARAVLHAQKYDSVENHSVALAALGADPEEVTEHSRGGREGLRPDARARTAVRRRPEHP